MKSLVPEADLTLQRLGNFHPDENWIDKALRTNTPQVGAKVRCHNCGQLGHKSTYCQETYIGHEEISLLLKEDDTFVRQN